MQPVILEITGLRHDAKHHDQQRRAYAARARAARARAVRSTAAGFVRGLATLRDHYRRWRAARHTVAALAALEDRLLDDIGLTRAGIAQVGAAIAAGRTEPAARDRHARPQRLRAATRVETAAGEWRHAA